MTIHDLCHRFNITPGNVYKWRRRGIIPPPLGGKRGPTCRYGQAHVEAIQAWLALRHHFVSGEAAIVHCRANGITLAQYVREREAAVRDFGIGIA